MASARPQGPCKGCDAALPIPEPAERPYLPRVIISQAPLRSTLLLTWTRTPFFTISATLRIQNSCRKQSHPSPSLSRFLSCKCTGPRGALAQPRLQGRWPPSQSHRAPFPRPDLSQALAQAETPGQRHGECLPAAAALLQYLLLTLSHDSDAAAVSAAAAKS